MIQVGDPGPQPDATLTTTADVPEGLSRASIRELLDAMEAQHNRIGVSKRTKALLFTAAQAIVQLAVRVAELEKAQAETPRIILPGS